MCVCVCVCVCVYVILEHEDKNVRAELIWRVLIATIKTPIHISQSKFSFQSLKHTIIIVEHNYRNLNLKTGTVEGEADMETVSCAFSLLCLILYMSGWSEVENEQRSGCGE